MNINKMMEDWMGKICIPKDKNKKEEKKEEKVRQDSIKRSQLPHED